MLKKLTKPLWSSGLLLILLGLGHVPIWLLDGSSWEGSVSWRKPILFGVSTGMTLCSLGWLADHLKRQPLDKPLAWTTSIALMIEVVLITLQRWRGVASHFNHATLFDTIVEYAMLTLICIAAGGISYFYVRCFGKLELDAGYAAAVRSGMSFLMISCLIGFAISFYGYHQVAEHLPPETIGGKGVAKFPHGVAIHALQIIPGVIWLMKRFHFRLEQRKFVVGCLTISFAFQIAFACYQTINGLSRVDLQTVPSLILVTLALLSGAFPVFVLSRKRLWQTLTNRAP